MVELKHKSSYIFAAAETLFGNGYYPYGIEVDKDFWSLFMNRINNKFLISFGEALNKKPEQNTKIINSGEYATKFAKTLQGMKTIEQHKEDMCLYIDSGGYQVQMNQVGFGDWPSFLDNYCTFLEDHKNLYDYGFALDLVYATGEHATYQKILDLNMESYKKVSLLSEEVRKKILFIYHYKTPNTLKIFEEVYKKYGNKFISSYWSLSASVAYIKATKTATLGYVVSILGLAWIVNHAVKEQLKELKIHFLAGCGLKDILFYKIVQRLVKKIYDINLEVTFDSSAAFKQVCNARTASVILDDVVYPGINIKENFLDSTAINSSKTNEYLIREFIAEMAEYIKPGLTPASDSLYHINNKGTSTWRYHHRMWLILHLMYFYRKYENLCEKYIDERIEDIENIKYDTLLNIIIKLTGGTLNKNKRIFVQNAMMSLDFIKNLDKKYLQKEINRGLANLEILEPPATQEYDFNF